MASTSPSPVSLLNSFRNAVIHNRDLEAGVGTDQLPYMQQYELYIQQDLQIILKHVLQKQEQKQQIMDYVFDNILQAKLSNEKWLIGLRILKQYKCLHPNTAEVCVPDDRLECLQYILQFHRPYEYLWDFCRSTRAIKCTEWLYQQYRQQHRFIKFDKRCCSLYIRDFLEDFERNVKNKLYFDHMKLRVQDLYLQGQYKAHKSHKSHQYKYKNTRYIEEQVSDQKLYIFLNNQTDRIMIYDILFAYENFLHQSDELNKLPSEFVAPVSNVVGVSIIVSKRQMYVQLILQALDDPLWRRVFFHNQKMMDECHHYHLKKLVMKKKFAHLHLYKRITYYLCSPYIPRDIVRFIINRMY